MQSRAEPLTFPSDHGVYGVSGDMSPWDLRFDPSNRAHLDGEADGRARMRVWTEPGLDEGLLVVRVGKEVRGYPMEAVAATIRFTFWEIVAGPFEPGCEYTFAFKAPNGKGVYLAPSGVTNAIERIDRWPMRVPKPMTVPDWAKGAVIYQIFPDRFARSGDEGPDWGIETSHRAFQGGNLNGITGGLGYLADLGVDLLYLNPIFTSPSNHRYDVIDYYAVDPMLGSNDDLRRLVSEAHSRDIKVILDASLNHVHPEFFAFADVREKGSDSKYWDWFVVDTWPLELRHRPHLSPDHPWIAEWLERWIGDLGLPAVEVQDQGPPVEPSYEAWYGVATMPRVNLANPDARAYMLDVAAHWPREYGIDGWRMDVVRYVDPDFWTAFRAKVRTANSEAYLLSEVLGDASPWLQGDRFDATMNYTFRELCLRFFATSEIEGDELMDDAARLWAQYAWPVTLANQDLLGSHDTPRFLTEAGGEVWRARLAAVFQMTFPGAPGIYYGDEIGMEGGEDPGPRGSFDWGRDANSHELYRTLAGLIALRRDEPALVSGEWRPRHGAGDLIVFERILGSRTVMVAINRGDSDAGYEAEKVGPRSALILTPDGRWVG